MRSYEATQRRVHAIGVMGSASSARGERSITEMSWAGVLDFNRALEAAAKPPRAAETSRLDCLFLTR